MIFFKSKSPKSLSQQKLTADSEILLSEEFLQLEHAGKDRSCYAAQRDANRQKNRYNDVLPYDITRVKIHQKASDPDASYINANHVAGFQSDKEWIVTQGPLPNTIEDFWWLVWEYDCKNIVMLCNPIEKGRIKGVVFEWVIFREIRKIILQIFYISL